MKSIWLRIKFRDAADREQFVAHAEINYLITEGWNVKAAYEFLDPNRDIDENQRDRVLVGIEPFIVPFLQLGVYYTIQSKYSAKCTTKCG